MADAITATLTVSEDAEERRKQFGAVALPLNDGR